MQEEIDSNLKRAYDDVLKEDIPDRFTELLAKLKDADPTAGKKADADGD